MSPRRLLTSTALIAGISLAAFFGYTRFEGFLLGPRFTLTAPSSVATSSPTVIAAGTSIRASTITVNGAPVIILDSGAFRDVVLPAPGYNIITVEATDRFGKTHTETRTVIYTPR